MASFIKLRTQTNKGYFWRKVVCEGCSKACRYRDFRPGMPSFQEIHASLRAQHETYGQENCRFRYKRRGTVLGIMHETKRKMWEEHTEQCMQAQAEPTVPVVHFSQGQEKEELPW